MRQTRRRFTAAKEAKRRSREAFGQVQITKRISSKKRKLGGQVSAAARTRRQARLSERIVK